jgi:hypothetical protein
MIVGVLLLAFADTRFPISKILKQKSRMDGIFFPG